MYLVVDAGKHPEVLVAVFAAFGIMLAFYPESIKTIQVLTDEKRKKLKIVGWVCIAGSTLGLVYFALKYMGVISF